MLGRPCGPTWKPSPNSRLQHRWFNPRRRHFRWRAASLPARLTDRSAKPPESMRCQDHPPRLRTRAAFGVRLLAGAVGPPRCCRRPTAPPLLPTDDRIFCGPDGIPLGARAASQPRPQPGLRLLKPDAPDGLETVSLGGAGGLGRIRPPRCTFAFGGPGFTPARVG